VEVVDSGPGISADNIPKLFGQYVQFDANTLQGGKGSGLGLWLSKSIVEMHGGLIGATSDGPGRGCTFFLELPLCHMNFCSSDSFSQEDHNNNSNNMGIDLSPTKIASVNSSDRSGDITLTATVERLSLLNPNAPVAITSDEPLRFTELISMISSPKVRTPSTPLRDAAKLALSLAVGLKAKQYEVLASHAMSPHIPNTDKVRRAGTHGRLHRMPTVGRDMTMYTKNLKVLLVDDSALSRKMVERTLTAELEGCVCHHAQNGLEAVQMIADSLAIPDILEDAHEQIPYDVILMDYYMPVMTGPEAVHLIRGQGYRGVVLAVTGVASESEFNALVGKGVDRILVKPFNLEAFKQALYEFR
jgi:CheY-like chemotaxis protein